MSVYVKYICIVNSYNLTSYDVAVIQWITSCHKTLMTTREITLWHVHVTSAAMYGEQCVFLLKYYFEGDKIPFKGSYDKQNVRIVVISYFIWNL